MTEKPSVALHAAKRPGAQWPGPTALILLSLIPVIAGAARLTELTGGAPITAQNARFFASPVPVVIHIVSVTVYSLLGAFQFVSALRESSLFEKVELKSAVGGADARGQGRSYIIECSL